MSKLGQGLSPEQKNEFTWWKDAWDAKMLEEHKGEWAEVFSTWVQDVLDKTLAGTGNTFSLFVHNETLRCFHKEPALRVP